VLDTEMAAVAITAADLAARHARDINCLSDADRNKRRRAIQTLNAALFDGAAAPDSGVASQLVAETIAGPLVAALSDSSEGNRESAIAFFSRALHNDASKALHARLFPLLLAAIVSRVGRVPFAEEAEELRLQLCQLLNQLLAAPSCAALVCVQMREVVDLLRYTTADAFPAVKTEASTAALHLVSAAAAGRAPLDMSFYVGPLVAAFTPALSHQRAPVRLGALEAIDALLPLGGEGLERLLSETLLPVLRQHTRFDRTPSVRRQLGAALAHWLQALPWRALGAKLEGGVLALSLGLVADEAPEVGALAYSCLADAAAAVGEAAGVAGSPAVGAAAVAADVLAAADAASVDDVAAQSMVGGDVGGAAPGPESTGAGSGSGRAMHVDSGLPADAASAAVDTFLPGGGGRAPRSLVRYMAGGRLASALPVLLEELKDWTGRTRVFAAGGLRSLLAVCEAGVSPHLSPVIAALCSGSRDEEADARRFLEQAGSLVGAFVSAEEQLAVLLPQLRGEVSGLNNPQHYTAALRVFAAAVASMHTSSLLPHVPLLTHALARPGLVEDEAPGLRKALASAAAALVSSLLRGTGALLASPPSAGPWVGSHTAGAAGEPAAGSGGRGVLLEGSAALQTAGRGGKPPRLARAMSRAMIMEADDAAGAYAYPHLDSELYSEPSGASAPAFSAAAGGGGGAGDAGGPGGSHIAPSAAVIACLSDPAVREPLLRVLLFLHEAGSTDEVAAVSTQCARAVSLALRCAHSVDVFALDCQRLLADLLSDCPSWGKASYHRRLFDTLLRVARPALAGGSWHECVANVEACVDAFGVSLAPHRDADLRVVSLALLDAFIIGAADPEADATQRPGSQRRNRAASATAASLSGAPAAGEPFSPDRDDLAAAGGRAGAGTLRAAAVSHAGASGGGGGEGDAAAFSASSALPAGFSRMDVAPSRFMTAGQTAAAGRAMALDMAEDSSSGAGSAAGGASGVGSGAGGAPGSHAVTDAYVDAALAAAAGRLVQEALLPNIVWRLGGVASTIRKVSVACLYSLARRGLLRPATVSSVRGELLPVLRGALSDDDAGTRMLATQAMACLLRLQAGRLDGDAVRALYVELLKRLDDSSDAVRVAACDCLRDLTAAVPDPAEVRGGPVEHSVDALLVHCDDADPRVQAAAYDAVLAWSYLQPAYARKQALAARDKHRNPARANQLVAAMDAFQATA
jgi:hypothetical protein